ncbi:hypothetical protein [Rhizobium phage RHph_X2_25]|nr:hypothetical protein [Rhizobium phage RHph_X2_25]
MTKTIMISHGKAGLQAALILAAEMSKNCIQSSDRGGWQPWEGGDNMPVPQGAFVKVLLRNGLNNEGRASLFVWQHGKGAFAYENDDDIVAYRVIKEAYAGQFGAMRPNRPSS